METGPRENLWIWQYEHESDISTLISFQFYSFKRLLKFPWTIFSGKSSLWSRSMPITLEIVFRMEIYSLYLNIGEYYRTLALLVKFPQVQFRDSSLQSHNDRMIPMTQPFTF